MWAERKKAGKGATQILEYTTSAEPQEAMRLLTTRMLSRGYVLDAQGDGFATFSKSPRLGWGWGCLALLSGGLLFIAYLLVVAVVRHRVTVTAYPQGSGARLVIASQAENTREDVERWIVEELGARPA